MITGLAMARQRAGVGNLIRELIPAKAKVDQPLAHGSILSVHQPLLDQFQQPSDACFGFTRMVGTIPADTEYNRQRLEIVKKMTPDKIAPFAVALMSEEAKDVTGQIFGVRNNEIMLFSQPRPIRTTQTSDGWSPETCLSTALPALRTSFIPLQRSPDVFLWDPF